MSKVKITKIKKKIAPGTPVPTTDNKIGNEVGLWAEDMFRELGYPINDGPGPDLPGLEIKTRREGTTSPMSIGSMTANDIINTPWDLTDLKEKMQQIDITKWDEDIGITVGTDVIDLRSKDSQDRLRDAYEHARTIIKNLQNLTDGEEVTCTDVYNDVYFEKRSKNSWQMRISAAGLKRIKSRTGSESIFSNKALFPDD